jgi:hypothetical protein
MYKVKFQLELLYMGFVKEKSTYPSNIFTITSTVKYFDKFSTKTYIQNI